MRSALRQKLEVWTSKDLAEEGASRRDIAAKLRDGSLRRCGSRWFITAATPGDVAAALRRGNRLTCVSALKHHGVWIPLVEDRHEISRRSSALRAPSLPRDVCASHGHLRCWPDDEPIMPVVIALEHAARCVSVEDFAILLDSVAHLRLVTMDQLEELLARLPQKLRRAIGTIEPLAESGTETRVRRYLRRLGARVAVQVRIPGVGRVDMVLGEKLIIECDSRAHHTDAEAYQADRGRDQQAVLQGYTVVRLTWRDVMIDWPRTRRFLAELVRRQIHRSRRVREPGLPESRPRLRTRQAIRAQSRASRRVVATGDGARVTGGADRRSTAPAGADVHTGV